MSLWNSGGRTVNSLDGFTGSVDIIGGAGINIVDIVEQNAVQVNSIAQIITLDDVLRNGNSSANYICRISTYSISPKRLSSGYI